jgi:hypothetical protein
MNPYLVLDVPVNADDQTIRGAYLKAVKDSPPEADPKWFQAVSQAYKQIQDQAGRNRHLLFNRDCPGESPLDALVSYARLQRHFEPLPFGEMKELFVAAAKTCGKENTHV